MNNEGNAIAEISGLYKELIEAYEIKDKRKRFYQCYKLANKASYKEIHFAITYIKEDECAGDLSSIPSETIVTFLKAIIGLFFGKINSRRAYLLDILEEARERKRKQ